MAVNLSNPSWSPTAFGETSTDLFVEHCNFAGVLLGSVAYGIFLLLWGMCTYYQVAGKSLRQIPWGLLTYITLLGLCSTLYYGATFQWMKLMYIDYRNFHLDNVTTSPELTGPLGFNDLEYATPSIVAGNVGYLLLNFLGDGLVVYRATLIWNYNWKIMLFPALIYTTSTIFSVLTVWHNSLPASNFFGPASEFFATIWVSLTVSLNVILTSMIVGKLLYSRSKLIAVLGKQHAKLYTSIAAMVIESAALYTVLNILFLIFFKQPPTGKAINFVSVILPLLAQASCIAPILILLRVALGRGYSKDTAAATQTGVSFNRTGSAGRPLPMNTLGTSKGSRTQLEEQSTWGIQKHEESMTSVV